MLQQTSSLIKLPREFVAFFEIARPTCCHEVTNVVGRDISSRNTRDRECVIDVMTSPFYVMLAIITFSILPFILFTNLLRSVCSRNGVLSSATCSGMSSIAFSVDVLIPAPALFGIIPVSLFPFGIAWVATISFSVFYVSGMNTITMLGAPSSISVDRFLLVSLCVCFCLCSMRIVICFSSHSIAVLASRAKSVLAQGVTRKVVVCGGINFLAFRTAFHLTVRNNNGALLVLLPASLAPAIQPVFSVFAGVKKLRCRRIGNLTSRAILQRLRGIIHDLNSLSFSLPCLFVCQGNKAITSSCGLITPSLDRHSIIPFFATQQEAERMVI
jgi:hypothetical protein